MTLKVGAEKKIVYLNVSKPTPVSQANVNTLLAITFSKEVTEQKVTKISDISGLSSGDNLYKIIQAAFLAGITEVVVKGKTESGTNYKSVLDTIENEYFGVVSDLTEVSKIAALSKETGAREKMLFVSLAKEQNFSNLQRDLLAVVEDTTTVVVSKNDDTTHGAVAGYTLSKFPGSALIANKLINGAMDSGLTGAEQGLADKNKCNYVAPMKGQLGLANGVTRTGDSIDFIHCIKALKFRLEEDVTLWLKQTEKPSFYDTPNLKQIILKRTAQFGAMGAIADDRTTVTFIPLENIPENDILNGVLTGVKITIYYKFGIKEIRANLYFAV